MVWEVCGGGVGSYIMGFGLGVCGVLFYVAMDELARIADKLYVGDYDGMSVDSMVDVVCTDSVSVPGMFLQKCKEYRGVCEEMDAHDGDGRDWDGLQERYVRLQGALWKEGAVYFGQLLGRCRSLRGTETVYVGDTSWSAVRVATVLFRCVVCCVEHGRGWKYFGERYLALAGGRWEVGRYGEMVGEYLEYVRGYC